VTSEEKKIVFIAPLDWGLGHATRCVPLIQELIRENFKVIIGGSGLSGQWIRQEFPELEYVEIPSEVFTYSKYIPMPVYIFSLFIKLKRLIKKENQWIDNFLKNRKVDLIISDNRYGFYSKNIPSVIITHQLYLHLGFFIWMQPIINRIIFSLLHPFDQIWVPDTKTEPSLSGKLSHNSSIPPNVKYIGPLSRFMGKKRSDSSSNSYKYKFAFVLSGPEPHRTILEKECLEFISQLKEDCVIVRGTNVHSLKNVPSHLTIIDFADSETLFHYINQSEIIVSRAGYSSLMDYACLQKHSVIIPTPGQTEQEYLARYHSRTGLFTSIKQGKLKNLNQSLKIKDSIQFNFSHQFSNRIQVVLQIKKGQ
jgi:uncharacterized protein (TIGR00661 family)